MVGALPEGARRYFVDGLDPISGEPRRRACIELATKERYFEVPFQTRDNKHVRPTLHMNQDQCAASWHIGNYLLRGVQARGTQRWDRFHRLENDKWEALADAGLTIIFLEFQMALNIRRGPWLNNSNHRILKASAKEMFSTLTWSDNSLFDCCYDSICDALGDFSTHRGTDEHRMKIWRRSKEEFDKAGLAANAKSNRWWTTEVLADSQRPILPIEQMVLIYIGYRRSWWTKLGETPLMSSHDVPIVVEPEVPDEGHPEAPADPVVEGAEDDAPADEDEPSGSRIGKTVGKQEVRRRKFQSSGQLQYCARVLSRSKSSKLFFGVVEFPRPVRVRFGEDETMVKTRKGTKHLMQQLTFGGFIVVIASIFVTLSSKEFAMRLGFTGHTSSAPILEQENKIVRSLWQFAIALAGSLALTHYKYQVPPHNFVGIIPGVGETKINEMLRILAKTFDNTHVLEELALVDKAVAEYLKSMQWPAEVWTRENLSYLCETKFKKVYPWLEDEIEAFAQSHATTLEVENSIRLARDTAKTNPQCRLDPKALWHAIILGTSLYEEYDRPVLPVTIAAKTASGSKLPTKLFRHAGTAGSLAEEQVEGITTESPNWLTHGARNEKLCALQTMAMNEANGDWDVLSKTWWSLLAVPGSLLMNKDQGWSGLVISSSPHGLVRLRWPVRRIGGNLIALDFSNPEFGVMHFDIIRDYTKWKVVHLEPCLPSDSSKVVLKPAGVIRVCAAGKSSSALEYCV